MNAKKSADFDRQSAQDATIIAAARSALKIQGTYQKAWAALLQVWPESYLREVGIDDGWLSAEQAKKKRKDTKNVAFEEAVETALAVLAKHGWDPILVEEDETAVETILATGEEWIHFEDKDGRKARVWFVLGNGKHEILADYTCRYEEFNNAVDAAQAALDAAYL